MPIHIVRDDITRMDVDAIVNAANNSLLGGGGVDGAIHRAAGPELLKECRTLGGCDTGDAKITNGYRLPARYVIHTVGPVWHGGDHKEADLLKSAYRRSLEVARDHGLKTVAFPMISTGVFGYPKAEALQIAMDTASEFLAENQYPEDVFLTVFDKKAFRVADSLYKDVQAFIDDNYIAPDGRSLDELARDETSRRRAGLTIVGALVAAPPAMPKTGRRKTGSREWKSLALPEQMSADLEDRLAQGQEETFSRRLLRLIDEAGMTDVECYKNANVDRRLFSKIRSNPNYQPKKSTAIAFAVALRLPLEKTQELLQSAGYTLTHSSRADVIVEYFIERGRFSVMDINAMLFAHDEPLIGT